MEKVGLRPSMVWSTLGLRTAKEQTRTACATVNISTKFEVSISTHYEDTENFVVRKIDSLSYRTALFA